MAKPKAFNTYLDNQNKLEMLSDAQAGRLYKALCTYAATGTELDFSDDPLLQYAFVDFSGQIDRDFDKYDDTVEKRKEAAKTAANARWKKTKKCDSCETHNENAKRIQTHRIKCDSCQEEKEEEKEKEDKEESKKEEKTDLGFCERVKDEFNRICKTLPSVRSLSPSRQKSIYRARELLGDMSFNELFKKIQSSKFLTGDNENGWKASFDWIFDSNNLIKILEGNYDNKKPRKGSVYSAEGASFDVSEYEGSSMFDD